MLKYLMMLFRRAVQAGGRQRGRADCARRGCLRLGVVACLMVLAGRAAGGETGTQTGTFCNPLNLDYRFDLDDPVRREAADPAVVYFDHEYWLFASKCGGYWHSRDFQHWQFVDGRELPIEDYAPAPAVINGKLYYTAFNTGAIFRGDDPRGGHWTKVGDLKPYADPDLFQDDDGKVYVYYGCSANGGISGVQLDPDRGFQEVGVPVVCLKCDPARRGWEVPGDNNAGDAGGHVGDSWIEGSWMTKHDGIYYLQYSAPGTQFHSYADGVFTGKSPLGPFTYAAYSPFSHKPTGFVTGAGHSGTFQDADGRWWHISSGVISVRHMFERRLCVFPAGFTEDGQLYCDTYLGDYPQYLPGAQPEGKEKSPGWMLLSLGKKAEASSAMPGHPAAMALDESIQTWWSAQTGNAGEWLQVDLGRKERVEALQINFADEGANVHGKLRGDAYQYYVEASNDGHAWGKILDRSGNHADAVQDYARLEKAVTTRFVRLVNVHCPAGAAFSVSGLRVFGEGKGRLPAPVRDIRVTRMAGDGRKAVVTWAPSAGAEFYIVRYGLAPDRLYDNYQIYNATTVQINALNDEVGYYFTVEAVNERGVRPVNTICHLAP